MTNTRPSFSLELSVQEFEKHYWYKQELVDICRFYHLPVWGTKADLEQRISKLLYGEEAAAPQSAGKTERMKNKQVNEISLHTRLIPEGFKFNQHARDFFARYYQTERFSFTKEMAAALREAESQGNHEMTVADFKKNRMKVAAILWKEVRDNPVEKKYTPELLQGKWEQVKQFQ